MCKGLCSITYLSSYYMIFLARLLDFNLFLDIHFTCKLLPISSWLKETGASISWLSSLSLIYAPEEFREPKHTGRLTESLLSQEIHAGTKEAIKGARSAGVMARGAFWGLCHFYYCCHDLDPKLHHDLDIKFEMQIPWASATSTTVEEGLWNLYFSKLFSRFQSTSMSENYKLVFSLQVNILTQLHTFMSCAETLTIRLLYSFVCICVYMNIYIHIFW